MLLIEALQLQSVMDCWCRSAGDCFLWTLSMNSGHFHRSVGVGAFGVGGAVGAASSHLTEVNTELMAAARKCVGFQRLRHHRLSCQTTWVQIQLEWWYPLLLFYGASAKLCWPPGWCERWRHVKWWHEVAVGSDPLTATHADTGWPPIVPRQAGHPASALMSCLLVDGVLLGGCLWLGCHSSIAKARPGSAIAVRQTEEIRKASEALRFCQYQFR